MKPLILFGVTFGLLLAGPANISAEPAKSGDPIKLSAELRQRCLAILRDGFAADEFWPSMHAAEALTVAGHGDEVRAGLLKKSPKVTDDQQRCGIAREMVRAGDRGYAETMLQILSQSDDYAHTHAAESLYKVYEIGDGSQLRAAMANGDNLTTCQLGGVGRINGRQAAPQAFEFTPATTRRG